MRILLTTSVKSRVKSTLCEECLGVNVVLGCEAKCGGQRSKKVKA